MGRLWNAYLALVKARVVQHDDTISGLDAEVTRIHGRYVQLGGPEAGFNMDMYESMY
jgi:hypothetical protein